MMGTRCYDTAIVLAITVISTTSITALVSPPSSFSTTRSSLAWPLLHQSTAHGNHALSEEDVMRQDIAAMREEAKQRLELLTAQMDDLLLRQPTTPSSSKTKSSSDALTSHKTRSERVRLQSSSTSTELHSKDTSTSTVSPQVGVTNKSLLIAPPVPTVDANLLFDTHWKVVVRVGNENPWENSENEKLLLIHLSVDFSDQPLKETDELLRPTGVEALGTTTAYTLTVGESWLGASSWTDGRQHDVKVRSTGGWKILPGQGPKGIDILRFYVDVEEEVCHDAEHSLLRCPAQRIYCTCGIFSMEQHNESELYKDQLRKNLDQLVQRHEDLCYQDDHDERLISFEQLARAKQKLDLRGEIKAATEKLTLARIRRPERGLLRLSRKGNVGITKEGQVCYRGESHHTVISTKNDSNHQKDRNGEKTELSSAGVAEYRVLGKFEAASVDRPLYSKEPSSGREDQLRP